MHTYHTEAHPSREDIARYPSCKLCPPSLPCHCSSSSSTRCWLGSIEFLCKFRANIGTSFQVKRAIFGRPKIQVGVAVALPHRDTHQRQDIVNCLQGRGSSLGKRGCSSKIPVLKSRQGKGMAHSYRFLVMMRSSPGGILGKRFAHLMNICLGCTKYSHFPGKS